jgi:ZIP family zinc transporter
MNHFVVMAFLATLGTWLVTALGAATVVFFSSANQKSLHVMLGFASGVMIAASFWSLLQPAIRQAEEASGLPAYLVATTGFLLGALFMWASDRIVSFARRKTDIADGKSNERLRRIIMLILSITLHNIPEGLAVGVAFGAMQRGGYEAEHLMGAISVAIGIGLQNFPEGAAVSLPLRREGFSRKKSFLFGQASGMVEPIAGVLGALLVVHVEAMLPYALSFAAGAMILVAVHELIPECQRNQESQPYLATMGIILGFAVMMLLDVMLA